MRWISVRLPYFVRQFRGVVDAAPRQRFIVFERGYNAYSEPLVRRAVHIP